MKKSEKPKSYKRDKGSKEYFKKLKLELFIIIAAGIILIAIGSGFLFGFYRPFVPWQKFRCTYEAGTLEYAEGEFACLYRYNIDGVNYEIVITNYACGHGRNGSIWDVENLYVNKNDPFDVKTGTFGTSFLVLMLVFIIAGIGIIIFAFLNYSRKTQKNNLRKTKKTKRGNSK